MKFYGGAVIFSDSSENRLEIRPDISKIRAGIMPDSGADGEKDFRKSGKTSEIFLEVVCAAVGFLPAGLKSSEKNEHLFRCLSAWAVL